VKKNTTTEQRGDITICLSYGVPVAAFVPGRGFVKTDKRYSVTTSKHANTFCRTEGRVEGTSIDHDEFIAIINSSNHQ